MFKAHDNTLYVPVNSQADPYGADCFRWGGSGVSIYSNHISGYFNGYTGSQHQDGCQVMGGTDIKIYNNYYFQLGNSACYISPAFQAQTYTYVYNNIAVGCHDFSFYMDVESGDVSTTLANCILANNITEPSSSSAFGTFFGGYDGQAGSFANNIVANNIIINESSSQNYFGTISQAGSATESDSVFLTTAQAGTDFDSYNSGTTNNNFHLSSAATALIAKGINLSSYFNIDMDSNVRPSGNWDIGPYNFSSSGGSSGTNFVISLPTNSLSFGSVLTNTTEDLIFTIQNSGGISGSGTATVSPPFSIVSGGTFSLGAAQSANVTVGFSPSAVGTFNGTVNFTASAGSGATGTVSGTGIATPPGPQVSAITQSGFGVDCNNSPGVFAGSTEQYSSSASDPSGLPLSWQWIYTVNGSSTQFQSGTGTVPTISFSYPASAAGNSYVWELDVSNGYATSKTNFTVGVEAPPVVSGTSGLTFYPSNIACNLTAEFALTNDYVTTTTLNTVSTNSADQMIFFFQVASSNTFGISAQVNAPSEAANSFYVNIDNVPVDPTNIWDLPITTGWSNNVVVTWRGNGTNDQMNIYPQQNFQLNTGVHKLIIVGREAGSGLGQILIAPLPVPVTFESISSP
jgi:hypothetical protein